MPTRHHDDWYADIERQWPRRDVADRWTPLLLAEGWTGIPNLFLRLYSKLEPPMSYAEAMFVIHVIQHKWDATAPFPAIATIADRMGVSPGTARGLSRRLEQKGYLKREGVAGGANKYHFEPMFAAIEELWLCQLEHREQQRDENQS